MAVLAVSYDEEKEKDVKFVEDETFRAFEIQHYAELRSEEIFRSI